MREIVLVESIDGTMMRPADAEAKQRAAAALKLDREMDRQVIEAALAAGLLMGGIFLLLYILAYLR